MKVIIRTGTQFRGCEILIEVDVADSAKAGRLDDMRRSFKHHLNDAVKNFVAPWWEMDESSD